MKNNIRFLNASSLVKTVMGVTMAALALTTCSTEAKAPVAVIGHNQIKLEVAQSMQEITHGLMYRTSMPEDCGMVFLFDPPRPVNFWMYHTLIPLDMIFINNSKIVKIFHDVQPCRSENPGDCEHFPHGEGITVSEVIEVNGGYADHHGIKEGQPVFFTLHPEKTNVPASGKKTGL